MNHLRLKHTLTLSQKAVVQRVLKSQKIVYVGGVGSAWVPQIIVPDATDQQITLLRLYLGDAAT